MDSKRYRNGNGITSRVVDRTADGMPLCPFSTQRIYGEKKMVATHMMRTPLQIQPLCQAECATQPTFKFDNNTWLVICSNRQISAVLPGECDTTSLSSESAPDEPLETNPWHVYARSWTPAWRHQANTLPQEPPEAQSHHESREPAGGSSGDRPYDIRDDSQQPTRRASALGPSWQEHENERRVNGAPANPPHTESRNENESWQTYGAPAEPVIREMIAKYPRHIMM
ncbi:hypothetical protein CEK25_003653 [Fusarium fujikuroi]|nr:hypothetical protein CEK25_003653 [Fusarium fujikuroi]